jgi:hypothetical protein
VTAQESSKQTGKETTAKEKTREEQSQAPVSATFWDDDEELANALTQAVPFHPLCLDQLPMTPFGDGEPEGRTISCDNTQTADILVRQSGWILSSFPGHEEGFSGGWAAYNIFERIEVNDRGAFVWIEATQNTGGTGNFDKIWLLRLSPAQTMQQTRFDWVFEIGGGDRCNDGKNAIHETHPGAVTYKHAATPYRLLNPGDDDNTFLEYVIRMLEEESDSADDSAADKAGADDSSHIPPGAPFMNWLAFDDVVNCATCCAGEITKTIALESGERWLEGVAIDPEIFNMDFFAHPALAECGASWLQSFQALAPERGPIRFSPDEWRIKKDELKAACQGVTP